MPSGNPLVDPMGGREPDPGEPMGLAAWLKCANGGWLMGAG